MLQLTHFSQRGSADKTGWESLLYTILYIIYTCIFCSFVLRVCCLKTTEVCVCCHFELKNVTVISLVTYHTVLLFDLVLYLTIMRTVTNLTHMTKMFHMTIFKSMIILLKLNCIQTRTKYYFLEITF